MNQGPIQQSEWFVFVIGRAETWFHPETLQEIRPMPFQSLSSLVRTRWNKPPRRQRGRRNRFGSTVERLETRALLASNITATLLADGTLQVEGTEAGDVISIHEDNNQFTVDGTQIYVDGEAQDHVSAGDVTAIDVDALGGDDVVRLDQGTQPIVTSTTLSGGDGDDSIIGGAGSDDIVTGNGNDTAFGGAGNDTLDDRDDADAGHDYLSGDDGGDTIRGGSGRDTLAGGIGDDLVDESQGSGDNQLLGGAGNDTLHGGLAYDDIQGGDGNDLVQDDGGTNWIFGQEGDDTVVGGNGEDHIFGGTGRDNLSGHGGDDLIDGEEGDDSFDAGDGDDSVWGGTGDDSMLGDAGDDHLDGEDGHDTLMGGVGDDFQIGHDGNDELHGDAGDDDLWGTAGNDYVVNDDGLDSLDGDEGLESEDERHLYSLRGDQLFLWTPTGGESLFASNVQSFGVGEEGIALYLLDLSGVLYSHATGDSAQSTQLATNVQSFTVEEDGETLRITYRDGTTSVLRLDDHEGGDDSEDHEDDLTSNDSNDDSEPRTAMSRSADQASALTEYAGTDEFLTVWNEV
jgi:Ca2+-binding RTX toxin-like protein